MTALVGLERQDGAVPPVAPPDGGDYVHFMKLGCKIAREALEESPAL